MYRVIPDKSYKFVDSIKPAPGAYVVAVVAVVKPVVEIDGGVPVIWALVAVMEYESPKIPVSDSPLVYPEPVSVISSAHPVRECCIYWFGRYRHFGFNYV